MREVVIHPSYEYAKTGLLGLLGDASVQIVDASDELMVQAFLELTYEVTAKRQLLPSSVSQ